MRSKVPMGLYLGPLLYITIIGILFYLHFSNTASFTSRVGHLSLSGEISRSSPRGEDRLKTLQIQSTGISFTFSRSSPIHIQAKNGLIHRRTPEYQRSVDGGLVIDMGETISLFIEEDPDIPGRARIFLTAEDPDSIRNLSIPFQLMQGFRLETAGGLPVVYISGSLPGDMTVLSLPMGARVDLESQRIFLVSGEGGFGHIIVKEGRPEEGNPYIYWLSQQGNILSKSEFDQGVSDYLSRAQGGWKNSRFTEETLTWETRGEVRRFNEKVAVALLTEAEGTRDYSTLLKRIKLAAERVEDLSLLSAPALGNIVAKARKTRLSMEPRREALLYMIHRREMEVFQSPDLYFLLTSGKTEAPLGELRELAAELSLEELSPAVAAGAFAFYLACIEEEEEPWPEIVRFSELPELVLLPSISVRKEGFFITSKGGGHPIKLSLEAGRMLLQSGELLERDIHFLLGRELIQSALKLGDAEGYLPRQVFFEGGEMITTGDLPPEEVYPLLVEKSRIPRFISLYKEMGIGRWLYTNADEVKAQKSGRTEGYLLSAPVGSTHFILLQGMRPGFRLRLLGVNWNSNPAFQNSRSGWFYDSRNRSLFVKLEQRREQEEILITYPIVKVEKKPPPPEIPLDKPEADSPETGGQEEAQAESAEEPKEDGAEIGGEEAPEKRTEEVEAEDSEGSNEGTE